jgi:hypothetical protein
MLWCKHERDCLSRENEQDGMRQNEAKTKINKKIFLQNLAKDHF